MSSALPGSCRRTFARFLDQIRHPELGADAVAVLLGISEPESGAASDHLEAGELPERGDQVLRDPIGEILLTRLAALVRKRQYSDGGRTRSIGFDSSIRSNAKYPSATSRTAVAIAP